MSEAGEFIGMDEAGYGPNLGPLLVTATCWHTPESPDSFDFYSALSPIVSAEGTNQGRVLHLADSKKVNVGKQGFASLERSALCLIHAAGGGGRTFHELWSWLTGNQKFPDPTLALWYQNDLPLPVAASEGQIADLQGRLQQRMDEVGISLSQIQGDVVVEHRFNQLMMAPGSNKALALSRVAFQLLQRIWIPDSPRKTLVVGDKHGGRNRYDELLSEILNGEFVTRLEEGQTMSRYRLRRSELRFQVNGEQHLPVACASIIAKYFRELSMDLLNQFWTQYCPDLKPTRGYPVDARRFLKAIAPYKMKLGVEDSQLWRAR